MQPQKIVLILEPAQARIAAEILEFAAADKFNDEQEEACAAVAAEIRNALAFTPKTAQQATATTPHPDDTPSTADIAARIRTDLEDIDWTTVDDPEDVVSAMHHRHIVAPDHQLTPLQLTGLEVLCQELALNLWIDGRRRS